MFNKVMMIAVSAFIFMYIIYLFFGAAFNTLQLETADMFEITDKIKTTGFIVRNESYVYNSKEGVLSYLVEDGGKVAKNGVIANIFKNESETLQYQKIGQLEEKIDQLKYLQETAETLNISYDAVTNKIELNLQKLLLKVNEKIYLDAENSLNDLMFSINERRIMKSIMNGEKINFEEEIECLEKEKSQLKSKIKSIGSIKSNFAGYFISSADGYETQFEQAKSSQSDTDKNSGGAFIYSDKTFEEFDEAQLKALDVQKEIPENVIGKVITNQSWYIICPVTAHEATLLMSLDTDLVTLEMPFVISEGIQVHIISVIQKSKKDDGLLILKCGYNNTALMDIRHEEVYIGLQTYEGIKINKKALHDDYLSVPSEGDETPSGLEQNEKIQGVYVLLANRLTFKQVVVIYSGDDFVICDPLAENENLKNGITVQKYDQIVIEGRNLYDGKIIG